MITTKTDLAGAFAKLARLASTTKRATRPAAQAAAQVFYEEVKARAPIGAKVHSTKGKKLTFQPGNLRDSIYQAHMSEDSRDGVNLYRVSWNKKKAFYGKFVEHGTSRMAAQPFLRPAYDAKKAEAAAIARAVLHQVVRQVSQK